MTDYIPTTQVCSRQKSRKVYADFQGSQLTSDAGALLLREVDRKLGLINAYDRCIPDPRQGQTAQSNPVGTLHRTLHGGWFDETDGSELVYEQDHRYFSPAM